MARRGRCRSTTTTPEGANLGELVDLVKGSDPRLAQKTVEVWRRWNEPESPEAFEERCYQKRSLTFGLPVDGMVPITGALPTLMARQVQAATTQLGGIPSRTDTRTTEQRQADGLVMLADAYAKGQVRGSRGGAALLINVPTETISGDGDEPGVTSWGDLVPAHVARRMAGHSILRDVLTNGVEVLALGQSRRLASPELWTALVARNGGCRWDGCDIPAEWCDADHFTAWEQGGNTDIDDLWLLCLHHHVEKHRPGVELNGSVHGATITLASGLPVPCPPRPPAERSRPRRMRRSAAA